MQEQLSTSTYVDCLPNPTVRKVSGGVGQGVPTLIGFLIKEVANVTFGENRSIEWVMECEQKQVGQSLGGRNRHVDIHSRVRNVCYLPKSLSRCSCVQSNPVISRKHGTKELKSRMWVDGKMTTAPNQTKSFSTNM